MSTKHTGTKRSPTKTPPERQECMIVVHWTAYQKGHPEYTTHTLRRGEVSADLGFDEIPNPPFTDREMQAIAFAAKMAAQQCMAARHRRRPR